MGRRMKTGSITASCIIVLIVGTLCLPVSLWQRSLQHRLPEQLTLHSLTGFWWSGQALVSVAPDLTPFTLTWQGNPLFEATQWRLRHPMAEVAGQITLDPNHVTITLTSSEFEPALITQVVPTTEEVKLLGERVQIRHWRMVYGWREKHLTDFSGVASWTNGEIQYPLQHKRKVVQVNHWQVVASQYQSQPEIALTDVSTQRSLAELSLEGTDQLALTLMPQFTEALGLSWHGGDRLPLLVMTYPLRINE